MGGFGKSLNISALTSARSSLKRPKRTMSYLSEVIANRVTDDTYDTFSMERCLKLINIAPFKGTYFYIYIINVYKTSVISVICHHGGVLKVEYDDPRIILI